MAFSGRLSALLIITAIYGAVAQNATTYDVLSYVNQLIGSSNGGSQLYYGSKLDQNADVVRECLCRRHYPIWDGKSCGRH
jgi:hypothetical protein